MEIINLTPHAITVDVDGVRQTFAPAGAPARVTTTAQPAGMVAGIPVSRTTFGDVVGLPAPAAGVTYIVSAMVAQAARRADVLSPDTGPSAIRDGGNVIAVRGFVSWVD